MRVSSPVGDFPFEPSSLRIESGALVVDGSMGAWPATVRVDPADVPNLLRLVPNPLLAAIATLAAVLVLRALRGSRKSLSV